MWFSQWTKDFAPLAQSQTHAQIWVRFINLPLEYWGIQTLLEIASGLGTPLSIDESTQQKRFGFFARVLIDVDLSENLFESVVVDREDHALSISVQYEKHPLFCEHCIMIGHAIQNCSKLGAHRSTPASVQAHKKLAHTSTKHGVPLKNVMNVPGKQSSNMVRNMTHIVEMEAHKAPASDLEKEVTNKNNSDGACLCNGSQDLEIVENNGDNLTLHNSFSMLESEAEQGTNINNTKDKEATSTILDRQMVKNPSVGEILLEKMQLNHSTNIESPSKLLKRVSKPMDMSSGISLDQNSKAKETTFTTLGYANWEKSKCRGHFSR